MKKLYIVILLIIPIVLLAQVETPFIVVDQFGYRPEAPKTAFIRNPQTGYDAGESFTPGNLYALVETSTQEQVFTGTPQVWNNGLEDETSGDIVWRFDFSEFKAEGEFYVLDIENNVKSYNFNIQSDIYRDVLIQAFKTFFYQRLGFAKETPYAGIGWADGASHLGELQDTQCREWGEADDVSTEKDVSGGWYDAGDYNKYTSWTAEYIIYMLLMYEENPEAWTDDFEIPESGNGIPDILDEAKFGLDHLLRLQFENGSCIAVVGVGHASPPSAATGPSFWGGPSTSATFACAAAYAYGAKVFEAMEHTDFAQSLRAAAISAWNWGIDNPSEIFRNNDSDFGTSGLAAGQQEVNEYGLFIKKMNAAAHLFALTGDDVYKNFFENNYQNIHLFEWTFAYPFEAVEQDLLLYYTTIGGASESVKSNIIYKYNQAMNGTDQLQAINNDIDAYMANLKDYTWGSNNIRMRQGSMFYNFISYGINESIHSQMQEVSERYVQYLHGANPLNKCYLSNMSSYGADNSVTEFYHSWFKEGSALWSNTLTSTYGPAPGFLVGGPNPDYDWDGCCPSGCGSTQNNEKCFDLDITPPKNQPKQKSYKDFNNGWPLNSWSVTENSNGYQVQYLRLLSKFVTNSSSKTQNIQLSEGWNLISINLHPADSSIETLFLGLDVAQIKNQDSFWIKNNEVHLNSLKHLKPTEGYLIKMNEAGTLIVNGLEANTNTFEANFSQNNNNGWQLIGVPFQRSTAISDFFNINNCDIIKDFEGFWDPESDINSISQLIPGKAYFLKQ